MYKPKFIKDLKLTDYQLSRLKEGASAEETLNLTYEGSIRFMQKHDIEIFDYIETCMGKLPHFEKPSCFADIALFYIVIAVSFYIDQLK